MLKRLQIQTAGGVAEPYTGLTDKQAAFVTEYLANGRNAAAAYRTAYETKASNQRAAEEAHALLNHPKIKPIIEEADRLSAAAVESALRKFSIDQEDVANRLAALACFDCRDVFQWTKDGVTLKPSAEITPEAAYAIIEIRQGPNGLAIKMADKRAALMDIARLRGWLIDKGQTIGPDGKPIDPRGITLITIADT